MKMAWCRVHTCVLWRLASEIVAGENRLAKFPDVVSYSTNTVSYGSSGKKGFIAGYKGFGATRGVTVSMSAFLACHQCYCAGSSLAWGLNLRAVVCGIF